MTVQKDPEGNEIKYLRQFADFNDKRVLEIGCGDGRLTWKYANNTKAITGIDLVPEDLKVASIECPQNLRAKTFFIRADSISIPVRPETFDIALLAWSL